MKQFINPQELFIILEKNLHTYYLCAPRACAMARALTLKNEGRHGFKNKKKDRHSCPAGLRLASTLKLQNLLRI